MYQNQIIDLIKLIIQLILSSNQQTIFLLSQQKYLPKPCFPAMKFMIATQYHLPDQKIRIIIQKSNQILEYSQFHLLSRSQQQFTIFTYLYRLNFGLTANYWLIVKNYSNLNLNLLHFFEHFSEVQVVILINLTSDSNQKPVLHHQQESDLSN